MRGAVERMVALADVSFDVRERELVSLLGASGCGKTTLLRIVAGLVAADEGVVTVRGARRGHSLPVRGRRNF